MSLDTASLSPAVSAPPASEDRNATVIAAIVGHHAALAEELSQLTQALLDAVPASTYEPERGRLLAWYLGELLPHAEAEEKALYGVGADLEPTRLLVRGMVAEHRALAALIDELADAIGSIEVVAAAAAAHALFGVHLGKENDLLLPALDAAGMDLGAALEGMHEILGAKPGPAEHEAHACGCGHDSADAGLLDLSASARPGELDVRTLPHGGRHEIIFASLDQLAAGESLVIVNDHDPKPLRYQTEAMWPDRFTWNYLDAGPVLWRVAISNAS